MSSKVAYELSNSRRSPDWDRLKTLDIPIADLAAFPKPPVATRFKLGQVANPSGRPKRPKSIREKFEKELDRKILVRENGREQKISKVDLWVRRVVAEALKGDYRMSRILLEMLRSSDDEIAQAAADQTIEELSAEDREILARHLGSVRKPKTPRRRKKPSQPKDEQQ